MSDQVITAFISLAGIALTAYITRQSMLNELDKRMAVFEERQKEMSKDLQEHNNYAKHIPEIEGNIKLILEKQSVANHRIDDLEKKVG